MGFFSWLTSDDELSIRNRYSKEGTKTVYLLQPGRKKNIREDNYEGYGVFGGKDAYVWLAEQNLTKKEIDALKKKYPDEHDYEEAMRSQGLRLGITDYFLDPETGRKWMYSLFGPAPEGVEYFKGAYNNPQIEYGGKCPNDLISEEIWERHPIRELIMGKRKYKPLKFSYDKDAVYEDLSAAKNDPTQGYFGLPDKELYEQLLESVILQIEYDITQGTVGALDELLRFTPTINLIGYLEEDEGKKYEGLEERIPVGKK